MGGIPASPVNLVRITRPEDVRDAELRERAAAIPLTKERWQFLCRNGDGEDLAFLSFDLGPPRDCLVLYQLWVPRARRGAGIGTAALQLAFELARDKTFARLLVRPHPLDDAMTSRQLRGWYERRGFTMWPKDVKVFQRET